MSDVPTAPQKRRDCDDDQPTIQKPVEGDTALKPFYLGRVQVELDAEMSELDLQRTAREVLAPEDFPALHAGGSVPWQPLDKIADQL